MNVFYVYSQMGNLYSALNNPDSAFWYAQKGFD